MAKSKVSYRVTIINKDANCGYTGYGWTKPAAFRDALKKANEEFFRKGGDKLTIFRTMFYDDLMRTKFYNFRIVRHPSGALIECYKMILIGG